MTRKLGRMATYPKLGNSQFSLHEERPHGDTADSMRVYVPSLNRPYPWSRWGLWPFWAIRPKFTQTRSLEKSYCRITREIGLGLLHGCKPKLCFPFATMVGVQSITETFSTPQSLKHTIYGKKCIYWQYWEAYIYGSLKSKNMSKHFWSRPIVSVSKYAHHG